MSSFIQSRFEISKYIRVSLFESVRNYDYIYNIFRVLFLRSLRKLQLRK